MITALIIIVLFNVVLRFDFFLVQRMKRIAEKKRKQEELYNSRFHYVAPLKTVSKIVHKDTGVQVVDLATDTIAKRNQQVLQSIIITDDVYNMPNPDLFFSRLLSILDERIKPVDLYLVGSKHDNLGINFQRSLTNFVEKQKVVVKKIDYPQDNFKLVI